MLQLDVDSDQSVTDCVNELLARTGRIDVLVNNAGFVLTGGIEETRIDEAKAQFETNFFGSVRVVNAVLPVMRKQRSGQIINMSSIAAQIPVPFEGYYGAAKAALLAFSKALRYEVKKFGIYVSVLEPGFFHTKLGESRRQARDSIEEYDEMRTRAIKTLEEDFEKGGDPKLIAGTILRIVESKTPSLEYFIGKSRRYLTLRHLLPESMFENGVRRHWKLDVD